MSELLEITTLGRLSFKLGEVSLAAVLSSKAQALLVYLACTRKPQTRSHLAELFWYERSEEQGLSNLRTLLSRIRPHLQAYLVVNRETVAFDSSQPYQLDVAELEQILTTARPYFARQPANLPIEIAAALEQGLALYKGEFLTSFSLSDAAGFEEWADGERENWHNRVIEALHQVVAYRENRGDTDLSQEWVERLLQLDPLREEAHRQRMLLLVSGGQAKAALVHYKNYQRYLARELDIAPEAETTDLYERIRQGKSVATLDKPLVANPPKVKINDSKGSVVSKRGATPAYDRVAQLKRVSLFVDTPDEVLQRMAASLEEVKLQAEQVIFQKGEMGQSMYIIVEGKVRVHDGRRTLNYLGERDIFGEMAVLDAAPRLATVTTLLPTRLWRLEQRDLYRLMVGQLEVVRGIIGVLSARLRERVEDLVDLQKRYEQLSER